MFCLLLFYYSEINPCFGAVCRFYNGYCIYGDRAAYCGCHDWTGQDCTSSKYGKRDNIFPIRQDGILQTDLLNDLG